MPNSKQNFPIENSNIQLINSSKKEQKTLFIIAIAVILLSIILIIVVVLTISNNKTNSSTQISSSSQAIVYDAEITFIEGKVMYKRNDDEWKDVTLETRIFQSDIISTYKNGKVIIKLKDSSELRLDGNTQIKINSLIPSNIIIYNNYGAIYSRVVSLNKKYTISTPKYNYTAKGTAFLIINNTNDEYVEVYESTISVDDPKKDDTVIDITQGKKFVATNTENSLENKIFNLKKSDIENDEFIIWNKLEDERNDMFKSTLGFLNQLTTPNLVIFNPIEEYSIYENSTLIKGITNIGNTILINNATVTVDNNGRFEKEFATPTLGYYVITITASDIKGEKVEKMIKFQKALQYNTKSESKISTSQTSNSKSINISISKSISKSSTNSSTIQ